MFIPLPEEVITGTSTLNPVVVILTEDCTAFLSSYRESQHSCLKRVRKRNKQNLERKKAHKKG
jgi:hypothetical protein